jgi:hypothetical protein
MTRLILTFDDSGAGALKGAGLADCVIPFGLTLQLLSLRASESMGNHDSEIVDAGSVD